jgi:hypothetical protein
MNILRLKLIQVAKEQPQNDLSKMILRSASYTTTVEDHNLQKILNQFRNIQSKKINLSGEDNQIQF